MTNALFSRAAIGAIVGATLATSAGAVSVTYEDSHPYDAPDTYPRADYLPQFDPSLGTLTGITATLYGAIRGYGAVEVLYNRDDAQLRAGNSAVFIADLPSTLLAVGAEWHGPTFRAGPFDGVRDFEGPDTVHGSGTDSQSSATAISDFTGYIGTGFVALVLSASTGIPQGVSTDGYYDYFTSDLVSTTVTLAYTYDAAPPPPPPTPAVPEPSSWALLIAGFGLTGLMARRRRPSSVAA